MITIQNLHKQYQDGETLVHALRGVSLEIKDAEFLAVAGPSGSGKTTLLNILGCIDTPDTGDVIIDGIAVSKRSGRELVELRRQKIGFVFQSFNLIPVLTAFENVSMCLSLLGCRKKRCGTGPCPSWPMWDWKAWNTDGRQNSPEGSSSA
jgi:putative ABC transport system ATP-binding protein